MDTVPPPLHCGPRPALFAIGFSEDRGTWTDGFDGSKVTPSGQRRHCGEKLYRLTDLDGHSESADASPAAGTHPPSEDVTSSDTRPDRKGCCYAASVSGIEI